MKSTRIKLPSKIFRWHCSSSMAHAEPIEKSWPRGQGQRVPVTANPIKGWTAGSSRHQDSWFFTPTKKRIHKGRTHISVWILQVSWKLGKPSLKAGACVKKCFKDWFSGSCHVEIPNPKTTTVCNATAFFFSPSAGPTFHNCRINCGNDSLEEGTGPVGGMVRLLGTELHLENQVSVSMGVKTGREIFWWDLSWEITLLFSRKTISQHPLVCLKSASYTWSAYRSSRTKDYVPIRPSAIRRAGAIVAEPASKRKWDHSAKEPLINKQSNIV